MREYAAESCQSRKCLAFALGLGNIRREHRPCTAAPTRCSLRTCATCKNMHTPYLTRQKTASHTTTRHHSCPPRHHDHRRQRHAPYGFTAHATEEGAHAQYLAHATCTARHCRLPCWETRRVVGPLATSARPLQLYRSAPIPISAHLSGCRRGPRTGSGRVGCGVGGCGVGWLRRNESS